MSRKGARQIFFVCIAMDYGEGKFVSKTIEANSPKDATVAFREHAGFDVEACNLEVLGPFFKKRAQVLEVTRVLKFTNQTRKAEYDGWEVNAFILKEPENQAYLVFTKRVDGKKLPTPKGTITVPISDLRFT